MARIRGTTVVPLPEGHPLRCSTPRCGRQRKVATPFPLCARCRGRYLRSTPEDINLILPDDGVFDSVAVDILSNGWRPTPIRATEGEYLEATRRVLATNPDDPVGTVSRLMHVSWLLAYKLVESVKMGIEPRPALVSPGVNIQPTPRRAVDND